MGDYRILTREEILAARNKLKRATVPVPEWYEDGAVLIREMKSGEQSVFQDLVKDKNLDSNAKAVSMITINEDGTPAFTAEDVKALSELGMDAILRIVKMGLHISGLSDEAIEAAKKKLAGQNGASASS